MTIPLGPAIIFLQYRIKSRAGKTGAAIIAIISRPLLSSELLLIDTITVKAHKRAAKPIGKLSGIT